MHFVKLAVNISHYLHKMMITSVKNSVHNIYLHSDMLEKKNSRNDSKFLGRIQVKKF